MQSRSRPLPIGPLAALPFWVSLAVPGLVALGAWQGGAWVLLPTVFVWWSFIGLDAILGLETRNPDPATDERGLAPYRAVTIVWPVLQVATIYGALAAASQLSAPEAIALFIGVGAMSGAVGIVYAHELMHQQDRLERWLADILMALALYGHFRSAHLLVHHRHVGTPADPVSAPRGQGFHRFFVRSVPRGLASALGIEATRLRRRGLPPWHILNPFWRYAALQVLALLAAWAVAGWPGVGLFVLQASVAIWQLELINYIEHYGLTRKHLGGGRYEPQRAHHSWNASPAASNRLLINLQRHADHHVRPDRRYPLLRTYPNEEAPALPYGYPVMTLIALIPPLWRRIMDPRVRSWRARHYPEIEDWRPYEKRTLPAPG